MVVMKLTIVCITLVLLFIACLDTTIALTPDTSPTSQTLDAAKNLITKENIVNFTGTENGNAKDEKIVEGRNKKNGVLRKMALPLLLLMGLKVGIAVPLVFGTVALAAFKGLWSGLTALVVTAALALKGLLPPPRIIQLPPPPPPLHHAHVTDYYTDYKRADDLSRVDDYRYGW